MPEIQDKLPMLLDPKRRDALRRLHESYRFQLVSAGFFRNRAPWSLAGRTCPDHFFLFPAKGRLRVQLEGRDFVLKPGEFLMLPEGIWHELEIAHGDPHLHQISIHAHLHDRWGSPLLESCNTPRGRLIHARHDLEALQRLVHLTAYETAASQAMAEAFLRQLLGFQLQLGTALFADHEGNTPERDPRVLQAVRRMERDLGSPFLSMTALADDAGITPVQFRKLFRRDTGSGPKEYLTRLRLRHAQLLLCQSRLTVKEIAGACGFNSDHYFHLAFREHYGCTPSHYRDQSRL